MTQKTAILSCLLFLSACQQFTGWNLPDSHPPETVTDRCQLSADKVLSCLASTRQLSSDDISSEFDSLMDSLGPETDNANLSKLLCLSLHSHSTKEQLLKGESLLEEILYKEGCDKQNLTGLLLIIQGNLIKLNDCLDRKWQHHLEKKKLLKKEANIKEDLDEEISSYKLRIQDLEQQVKKLKEIESMVDKKVSP